MHINDKASLRIRFKHGVDNLPLSARYHRLGGNIVAMCATQTSIVQLKYII